MEPRSSLTDRESILPRLNTVAFLLLTSFVGLVPFPYGAVTPTGVFALTASAFVIAALSFLTRAPAPRIGVASVPVVALVLLAIAGAIQLVPMSIDTLRRVSPVSAGAYGDANEIMRLFNRPLIAPKISIAPMDTKVTILLTLAYASLFLSGAILCSTRKRRRILLGAFLLSATIHILYSTVTTEALDRLHGTFINPNHFAGYLQIALACAFGIAWRELMHNKERAQGIRDLADRWEKRAIPLALSILLWAVAAAGIALTRSRGGILAATFTTVVLVILASMHRRATRTAMPIVIVLISGLLFVAVTTGNAPLLRFLGSDPRDIGTDTRTEIWSSSIRAFRHSPLLGTGLGTFREAFRRVQPASIEGLVEQAHNDFLQMLVTGGWVGAALATIAFLSMLVILIRAWLRQQHREESAFALAGIGAMISLILHGLVEFNMSIPAIPATLAVMVGLAWAAACYETKAVTLRAADREP